MPTTNTFASTASTTYLDKTFYDRLLLETSKTKLVHASYGQKKTVPKNSGRRVEFRRPNHVDPNLVVGGLTEGVTPDGLSLSQGKVEAELKSYGAYFEVSDMLEDMSFDNIATMCTVELGELMGVVVEWVTRNEMNSGTNVQYAAGRANRLAITTADKLTVTEIRKAVRTLKKKKAVMFSNITVGETKAKRPHFVCICSPDATFDLQSDTLWQDVSKYSAVEQIYSGEIGRLFGVVFVESTEAKIFTQSVLTTVASHTTDTAIFVLAANTAAQEAYLQPDALIKIGTSEYTVASYVAATKTLTVTASVGAVAGGTIVYSEDAGAVDATSKAGIDVHSTLVFGQNAYGVIRLEGEGQMETIPKPRGSGNDPLNQRATFGAKVHGYTSKIINNDWLVRIEHAVSA